MKNPIVGRPIVAGYNWILTPASIFVGTLLKDFYSKFNGILKDSLSLVKILEKTKFNIDSFLCAVDFESLYTNIPVLDAIEMVKRLASVSISKHNVKLTFRRRAIGHCFKK